MKALLIDDERRAHNELRRMLVAHPDIEIVGEAVDVEDALEKIAALKPARLFLDIPMPGADGFSLLEQLRSHRRATSLPEGRTQSPHRRTLEDKVFVRESDRCWFVLVKNIRLLESEGNYARVSFDDCKPPLFRSLTAMVERLDSRHFFRANRQQVIALACVEAIEPWFSGGLLVKLKGGLKVELSRRQAQDFREKMSL